MDIGFFNVGGAVLSGDHEKAVCRQDVKQIQQKVYADGANGADNDKDNMIKTERRKIKQDEQDGKDGKS